MLVKSYADPGLAVPSWLPVASQRVERAELRRFGSAEGVDLQNALLARNADPKGKPVVPCAAMDPHAVRSPCPEAVIGEANAEEAEEGPRQAEAHETDLA